MTERAMAPHCDSRVLHAPGECRYCDDYPDWQAIRELWGINFTGKSEPEKTICPSLTQRTLATIEKWPGNRAEPARPTPLPGGLVDDPEKLDESLLPSGQQKTYLVLSEGERAKGFIRPLRESYLHVGAPPSRFPLRDLTPEESERYAKFNYVKFEAYPESESPVTGNFWTQARLDAAGKGCGTRTTMGRALAETYARDPKFYGSTFCCGCGKHLPVGAGGEFVWDDGSRVGT